ncbi:(2Fe-2S)-binding protein [Streptomyces fragilis]|uniref:(2Fe-2S)-binding protein n=1 Tax=Streptomyces fragilis TaxID=67301 RepID=A0ABV2YEA6_9ACTN|nr:(2Fe-2S)-binding protein [Streptomyces fragilis]
MTDDQHEGNGAQSGPSRWDPLPQGEYDDGATAFVQLPEGGIDALLAAPGQGFVPPRITAVPHAADTADPAAPTPPAAWHQPDAAAPHQAAAAPQSQEIPAQWSDAAGYPDAGHQWGQTEKPYDTGAWNTAHAAGAWESDHAQAWVPPQHSEDASERLPQAPGHEDAGAALPDEVPGEAPGPEGPEGGEDAEPAGAVGVAEPVPADAPAQDTGADAEPPLHAPLHDDHPLASYVLRVNGVDRPVTDAWLGESLLYVLRERLGLAGAKDGCSQGECGACNVQVDGRLVASCLVPAVTTAGSEVRTVEGLPDETGQPSDVQRALARCGAVQCGFCIPGMAMTVHDLLERNPAPTRLDARTALSGNLCRCSGYGGVLDAVEEVVAERRARQEAEETGEAGDEARHHDGAAAAPAAVYEDAEDGGHA